VQRNEVSLPGAWVWCVPQITKSPKIGEYRRLKKGVQRGEAPLPRALGVSPNFTFSPKTGGVRGG
jgi:hypothetical protein